MEETVIDALKGTELGVMTIGYLDILGMSEAILESPPAQVAQTYVDVYIAQLASHLYVGGEEMSGEVKPVKYFQFSDSSLFVGGGRTAKDVRLTVSIISGMMTTLLYNWNIVARGAVAIGDFCVNENFNIYVGRPLVEAVTIESCTDWVGLTLLKPLDDKLHLLVELDKYSWLSKSSVPIKAAANTKLEKLAISADRLIPLRWFSIMSRPKAEELPAKLAYLAKETDDKSVVNKLENGAEFIRSSLLEGTCDGEVARRGGGQWGRWCRKCVAVK